MAFFIVYIFCFFIFFKSGKGSLARLLSLTFLMSLTGYLLLFDFGKFELIDIVHAIWICITIGAVVWPWKDYKNITEIVVSNRKRSETLGTILTVLCIFMSICCAILAFFVITLVDDINRFKYVDGATDFYYSLGMDMKGFILTTLLYPLGYLLVPYVFYYLSEGRYKRAFFSFIGSMLPVFYGLTYFSRSHMTHFVLVYIAAYFLLHNLLSIKLQHRLRNVMILAGICVVAGFISISTSRFEEHEYDTGNREITTSNQSSTFVSTVDYLSQWYPISEEMFRRFNGQTMNNGILIQSTESFFYTVTFGIIPNHAKQRMERREKLFKEFKSSFIGLGAYVLYDQGPILGLILLVLFYGYIRKLRPKRYKISLERLLTIFALIQIPLCAIFYSVFDVVLLTLLLLFPIKLIFFPRNAKYNGNN